MSVAKEFREFAVKGNAVDLAIGFVIGAAFTTIVNSLVKDIIMPPIGYITGGIDFSDLYLNLSGGDYPSLAAATEAGAATINYGLFINAIVTFFIVAWALFMVVKLINRLRSEKEEPAEPAAPPKPTSEDLLTEIRDILKSR